MATKPHGAIGFHAYRDYTKATSSDLVKFKQESEFTYRFANFFHPFVGELIEKLNKDALPGLLDPLFHEKLGDITVTPSSDLPGSYYSANPSNSRLVKTAFQDKNIDVAIGGPYANYNWELLFHIPLSVAVHLSKNQRFAEAQRWFHFIFDPTANEESPGVPERFWRFLAFRKAGAGRQIDDLLALLSKPTSELTAEEFELKAQILAGYEEIKSKPFQPHAVARTRPLAYMYSVVMKYLDNLVAWGDHLFRQDTLETINEASQVYVLASNILGLRPDKIPLKGQVKPKTFAQLKAGGLDAMGNALVELEGQMPFNFGVPVGGASNDSSAPLFGIGRTLYFCVPRNEKLLSYWDTVGDRLFKIRHCMNIEGVVRPLALFDPPLDPGMLVKAAAAGIDVGAIVAGLNQPASPVRAQVLIQKALELAGEVRAMGGALLQVIEKGDAEQLALLRQGHEIKIQQMQQDVAFLRWKQAQESSEALLKSRATTLERYQHYLRMLGRSVDQELVSDVLALDRRELKEENFEEAFEVLVGQYERDVPLFPYPELDLKDKGSPAGQVGAKGPGKLGLTTNEADEIDHLEIARNTGLSASIASSLASAFAPVPDADADFHYWGIGGKVKLNVGTALVGVARISGDVLGMIASWEREQAGLASRTASYERRVDDWVLQANLAARELRQVGRQIISSLIAEQLSMREHESIKQQITHSTETRDFLTDKFSNSDLYAWMHG